MANFRCNRCKRQVSVNLSDFHAAWPGLEFCAACQRCGRLMSRVNYVRPSARPARRARHTYAAGPA